MNESEFDRFLEGAMSAVYDLRSDREAAILACIRAQTERDAMWSAFRDVMAQLRAAYKVVPHGNAFSRSVR